MIEKNKKSSYNKKHKNVKTLSIPISWISLIMIIIILGIMVFNNLKGNKNSFDFSLAGIEIKKNSGTEIDETLDITKDTFWNNGTLGVGLFWTDKIEVDESTEGRPINKTLDHNMGVYVTNDGKNFTYVSETGISGRDPNMIYKNVNI